MNHCQQIIRKRISVFIGDNYFTLSNCYLRRRVLCPLILKRKIPRNRLTCFTNDFPPCYCDISQFFYFHMKLINTLQYLNMARIIFAKAVLIARHHTGGFCILCDLLFILLHLLFWLSWPDNEPVSKHLGILL